MLFDVRTYETQVGKLNAQLELYEKYGREIQYSFLGEPVFFGIAETGSLNTFTHIWAYENAGDREAKRKELFSHPNWLEYMKETAEAGYLIKMTNTLMNEAPFFQYKR